MPDGGDIGPAVESLRRRFDAVLKVERLPRSAALSKRYGRERWTAVPRAAGRVCRLQEQGRRSRPPRGASGHVLNTRNSNSRSADSRSDREMILVLDNRDSFVHNLARYVRELGEEAVVRRSDEMKLDEVERLAPSHIIISPGPCTPAEAGISTEVVQRFGSTTPILGVCLGHQCIGAAFGGDIVRARYPMHGKTSLVTHDGSSVFAGLPSPLRVARYHSLIIDPATLPDDASRRRQVARRWRDHGGGTSDASRSSVCSSIPNQPRASTATRWSTASFTARSSRSDSLPPRADGAEGKPGSVPAVGGDSPRIGRAVRPTTGRTGEMMHASMA